MRICEVAVIGGGPAGAVVALRLGAMGRDVLLCEAAAFPRPHIGISLSPGLRSQLSFLGLGHLLDHPAHRAGVGIERCWEDDRFTPVEGVDALLADRGVLDAGLLAAAGRAGVAVLQPARVTGWRRAGHRWHLDVASDGPIRTVDAAFVVDATGRATAARRVRQGPPTLAVYGEWLGPPPAGIRISAQAESWSWGAPTRAGTTTLICFVDPKRFRGLGGTLTDRYAALARASEILADPDEAALSAGLALCDATPVLSAGAVHGLLRVGDADAALDPLSSSGVQAAVQSALAAAPVINTLLSPAGDASAASAFWSRRRTSRMAHHIAWGQAHCRQVFARHRSGFWAERCRDLKSIPVPSKQASQPDPDRTLSLSPAVVFQPNPCLRADKVVWMECVAHPDLDEPVAFVGRHQAAPLLRHVCESMTARDLMTSWMREIGMRDAFEFLIWAWNHNILRHVDG